MGRKKSSGYGGHNGNATKLLEGTLTEIRALLTEEEKPLATLWAKHLWEKVMRPESKEITFRKAFKEGLPIVDYLIAVRLQSNHLPHKRWPCPP